MCWGLNSDGQFGNTTSGNFSLSPISIHSTLADAVAITAGTAHTCALKIGGGVVCWGLNGSGQVGDTTTTTRTSPISVLGLSDVKAIASGAYYNCAVMAGNVYCWGATPLSPPLSPILTATAVASVSSVTGLSAGTSHVCAVRADTTVVCWGQDNYGQLGDGAVAMVGSGSWAPSAGGSSASPNVVQIHTSTTPPTTINLSNVKSVAVGDTHSCALMNDGKVKCWGNNNRGALGTTNTAPWGSFFATQTSAIEVDGLSSVTQLVAGHSFNCALLSDKTVKCWGDNSHGQLGTGSKTTTPHPHLTMATVIGLGGDVAAITAGEVHACALLTSGVVKCWGENGLYGNLGNTSTADSLTPISTSVSGGFGK